MNAENIFNNSKISDFGLYTVNDILKIDGFPYKKTWIYKNCKEDGDFIIPVKHGNKTFFTGKDLKSWFFEISTNYKI